MARFEPFVGIRFAPGLSGIDVLAPPYDVLSEADRAVLAARSRFNIVHIDVPIGPEGYEQSRRLLEGWQEQGVLIADSVPSFTAYQMAFSDAAGARHLTRGVIGALELMRPGEGDVLPHEKTTPKAKSDRLQLLRSTAANVSPVWGLSLASGLTALIDADPTAETVLDVTDDEGVEHVARRVTTPDALATISAAVAGAPVVIADGHHRYETSLMYRNERRDVGAGPGPDDLAMAFVVELADEHLHVEAIHRLLTGLPDGARLARELGRFFDATPVASPLDASITTRMADAGALCLVGPDGAGTLLRPRASAFDGVDDLDTARLDHALAGIPHELAFQHGVDNVLAAVAAGKAQVGVLLRPVPVPTIEAFARERRLMPPKSTFFAPKPKTGVVLRSVA